MGHDQRLAVLRQNRDIAETFTAQFFRELREAGCARQIDHGAGFEAVAISTAHHGQANLLSQADNADIFTPGAITVDLQRVDTRCMDAEEFSDQYEIRGKADRPYPKEDDSEQ